MRLPSDMQTAAEGAAPPAHQANGAGQPLHGNGVAESQDSLDDYYDASGTLRRGRGQTGAARSSMPGCSGNIVRPRPMSLDRRRHASSGSPSVVENGHSRHPVIENGVTRSACQDNYISSPCVASKGPVARVRHSSCCDSPGVSSGCNSPGLPSKYSTPYHSANLPLPSLVNGITNGGSGVVNGCNGTHPASAARDLSHSFVGGALGDRRRYSHLDQSSGSAPNVVLASGGQQPHRFSVVQSNGSTGFVELADPRFYVNPSHATMNGDDRGPIPQVKATGISSNHNGSHRGPAEEAEQQEKEKRASAFSDTINVVIDGIDISNRPSTSAAPESSSRLTAKLQKSCESDKVNRKGYSSSRGGDTHCRSQGNSSSVQYVPCVEVENDPAFDATADTKEGSPRKSVNYTEFVLDKSGITGSSKQSSPQELAKDGSSSRLDPAISRRCQDLRDGSPKAPTSKTSSCLSLNFAWRKNYIPFMGTVDETPSGAVSSPDGFMPSGCPDEPLLQGLSPCQPEPPVVVQDNEVTMYTFDKAGAGGTWSCREELAMSNLRLTHPAPHLMVTAQWQQHNRMSCLYLGYRLFWALYFVMWSVWSLAGSMGYQAPWSLKVHYFTYLTNWSIWLLALDTSLQAANVLWHMCRMADQGDARYPFTPKIFRLSWVLSNITFAAHLFITLAYWTTVYPLRDDQSLTIIGVNTHLIPGLYVVADALISATPRRLLHCLHGMLYFLTYVMFNMLYYLLGGTDYQGRVAIYPFMDWSLPGRSLLVVSAVLLLMYPFLHVLHCGIYAVRVRLWRRYRLSRYIREEGEMVHGTKFEEQIV